MSAEPKAVNCPNCSAAMDRAALGGIYGPDVEVDLCHSCHVLWLDGRESIHLSPRGTLDLFRLLSDHLEDARHALGSRLECPRCQRRLSLMHDIGKAGRFSYWACPGRHGRLTPFSEFLKEKQFVRALAPAERHRVRAEVKQVRCSSCGAPVDLARGFRCEHCGTPLTVLDAEAVEKALRELERAEARRSGGEARAGSAADEADREARARALAALEALRTPPEDPRRAFSLRLGGGSGDHDLLTASIRLIFRTLG